MRRIRKALLPLLGAGLVALSAPSFAAVKISFMSRDFGNDFPHTYIVLSGATDAAPDKPINANYGFTAIYLGPLILVQTVPGEVDSVGDGYIRGSERHFSMTLTDAQYEQVVAVVDKWKKLPRYSYNLHKQNCVHFVKEVAVTLGLHVDHADDLMMKPRSFLDEVGFENAGGVNMADAYTPKLDPKARKRMIAIASASKAEDAKTADAAIAPVPAPTVQSAPVASVAVATPAPAGAIPPVSATPPVAAPSTSVAIAVPAPATQPAALTTAVSTTAVAADKASVAPTPVAGADAAKPSLTGTKPDPAVAMASAGAAAIVAIPPAATPH